MRELIYRKAYRESDWQVKGGRAPFFQVGRYSLLADFCLLLFLGGVIGGFYLYGEQFFSPYQEKGEVSLSYGNLPLYSVFTLWRGFLAYGVSLLIALLLGVWAAKDRVAEKIIVPLMDLGQSVPMLGFMPGLVLMMIALFPQRNCGLEIAAILLMSQNQVWNMGFGVYHAIRTVPEEKIECAKAYRLTSFQILRWVEIPFSTLSLVWNSIMSVAAGWFFLMINEAFQLGNRDFRLPGLGSYMSLAAEKGDLLAMGMALLAMVVLILLINKCFWDPLIVWSEKFRMEEVSGREGGESTILNLLKSSYLVAALLKLGKERGHKARPHRWGALAASRLFLLLLLGLVLFGLGAFVDLLRGVSLKEWLTLLKEGGFSLMRVAATLAISTLIALPIGISVGSSEKLRMKVQSIMQVAASFPATLFFPLLIFVIHPHTKISLEFLSLILMMMGSIWYILFNVIAGARALPADLKEVAETFQLRRRDRFWRLYLPGVFPYLITGMISAAGGAWNTSIVAEYISYQGGILTVPGLGSAISLAAQEGNIPLLTASVGVMMGIVTFINLTVWLRLYHYSEKWYAFNY